MNNEPKVEIIPPAPNKALNGSLIGPLATLAGEPGQARKGAATACDVCAEMWLVRLPPKFFLGEHFLSNSYFKLSKYFIQLLYESTFLFSLEPDLLAGYDMGVFRDSLSALGFVNHD